jgi:hypothetical protein
LIFSRDLPAGRLVAMESLAMAKLNFCCRKKATAGSSFWGLQK